jgi:hypothetical protein
MEPDQEQQVDPDNESKYYQFVEYCNNKKKEIIGKCNDLLTEGGHSDDCKCLGYAIEDESALDEWLFSLVDSSEHEGNSVFDYAIMYMNECY